MHPRAPLWRSVAHASETNLRDLDARRTEVRVLHDSTLNQLALAVYRNERAASGLVLRRGEEDNGLADLLGLWPRACSAPGMAARFTGVSMMLGTTAFTHTPCSASSSESESVMAATAALEAAYALICAVGTRTGRAATFTIRPSRPSNARTASRLHRKLVVAFIRIR